MRKASKFISMMAKITWIDLKYQFKSMFARDTEIEDYWREERKNRKIHRIVKEYELLRSK